MSKNQEKIEEISSFLSLHEPFTKEKIMEFYAKKGEVISKENLRVRINRLKSKGVIVNVGRG